MGGKRKEQKEFEVDLTRKLWGWVAGLGLKLVTSFTFEGSGERECATKLTKMEERKKKASRRKRARLRKRGFCTTGGGSRKRLK